MFFHLGSTSSPSPVRAYMVASMPPAVSAMGSPWGGQACAELMIAQVSRFRNALKVARCGCKFVALRVLKVRAPELYSYQLVSRIQDLQLRNSLERCKGVERTTDFPPVATMLTCMLTILCMHAVSHGNNIKAPVQIDQDGHQGAGQAANGTCDQLLPWACR